MTFIGKIKIDYLNNITQIKDVVDQTVFDTVIKPLREELQMLQFLNASKESINNVKSKLDVYGSNFVTTGSPIYLALETGLLVLPEAQGGTHKCKITVL